MLSKKTLLLAAIISCLSLGVWAASTEIIATVGDDAITTQDLIARTRLIIVSSGLKADEDTAKKIAPQILQGLISERLEVLEAQKLEIPISKEEIAKAIASIEQQNKMGAGQLKVILTKAHIPISTLEQQVKGQIAWAKIRGKKIQPKIFVTDEEVDDYLKAQSLQPVQVELNVNEIILPVETPKEDAKVKTLANKLTGELQKGGDFKKIARQFSQAASAANGGAVGWLAESQIPKELLEEIKAKGPNKIIGPIKSVEGYFILRVDGARDADKASDTQIITLRHFETPLNEKTLKTSVDKINAVEDPIRGCKDSQAYADSLGVDLQDYGSLQVKELQPAIRKMITGLPVARYSHPLNTGTSLVTFLICSKVDTSKLPDEVQRNNARETLFKRKVELESRTYLRGLRRNTNIEVKI